MKEKNSKQFSQSDFDAQMSNSRFAVMEDGTEYVISYPKDMSLWDRIVASLHNYWGNSKTMLKSSLGHFRSPSTLFVLIILVAVYILLTVGQVGLFTFEFRYGKVGILRVVTNLDVIVNAILGYFYGPVVSAVSFLICSIARMWGYEMSVYMGYIFSAVLAGFLHGWILYRHRAMWFGTRFRGFFSDLLSRILLVRLIISVFVNIFFMALMHRILLNIPMMFSILNYKSAEELQTWGEVTSVVAASILFETVVIFVALSAINFVVIKAFPEQMEEPGLMIDDHGNLINLEEDDISDLPPQL